MTTGQTLATLQHLQHRLTDGAALWASPAVAVVINADVLTGMRDPAHEIQAAINFLTAYSATTCTNVCTNVCATSTTPAT